jgi:formylglycine-generating enzyme required for sulfatase activity
MDNKAVFFCAAFFLMFILNAQSRAAAGEFVFVQGGTFTMGSPASEQSRYDNEGPEHQVTVSGFYIGKYEVTQKEYYDVMGINRFRAYITPTMRYSFVGFRLARHQNERAKH